MAKHVFKDLVLDEKADKWRAQCGTCKRDYEAPAITERAARELLQKAADAAYEGATHEFARPAQ